MSRSRSLLLIPALLVYLTFTFMLAAQNDAGSAASGDTMHMIHSQTAWDVHHDVSPPLSELIKDYEPTFKAEFRVEPDLVDRYPRHEYPYHPDGALQTEVFPGAPAATVTLNFDGVNDSSP